MGFSPVFLEELRRCIPLSEIISRRGVELVRHGREFTGLCPFHNEKTPSFFVVEDKGFFHCFGCGAHGDAINFVMRAEKLKFRVAVKRLAGELGAAVAAVAPPPVGAALLAPAERREKEERNRQIAWRLWLDTRDPRGTPVETYLRGRGVGLPPAPVLRFAPRCWNRETGRELPAMLARVDDANGEFIAIHRTWLTADGRKAELAEPKWSLASTRGGAVRLAPPGAVLAIAEGIETALTAILAGYAAWSAVSKGGFKTVALPGEVREVLIVADHDKNGEGEHAARKAADRWHAEGRRVRLWLATRAGDDLNDVIRSTTGGERE
jgi:DNA primase